MSPRLIKCLRRIQARKSVPDFEAYMLLAEQGFISIKGPSDDIETIITQKGNDALKTYKKVKV